jgi:hypothetical protein
MKPELTKAQAAIVIAHDSRQQQFELAHAAFTTAPEDSPEAVPFYRAHAGLRAAWGAEFVRAYDSAVHRAACNAGWAKDGERYRVALDTVRSMAQEQTAPQEPRYRYCYDGEPREPNDADVLEFFRQQWRAKYPGKRVNSREALAKFEEVKGKALTILQQRHAAAMAERLEKHARIDRENAAARAKWQEAIDHQNAFRAAVAALGE